MSRSSFQQEKKADYELHEKSVSSTYIIKTGTNEQAGMINNPVNVNVVDNFTLTVGSGQYIGQPLLLVCSALSAGKVCTISVTLHETSNPETFTLAAVDEYLNLVWTSSEWATVSGSATAT